MISVKSIFPCWYNYYLTSTYHKPTLYSKKHFLLKSSLSRWACDEETFKQWTSRRPYKVTWKWVMVTMQSYMRLKWPCRSGCTPKTVRFYPSTSATSILFVARIKKMAPKEKVLWCHCFLLIYYNLTLKFFDLNSKFLTEE